MSEFYGEKPMPDWLREILVMCSGSDVAATLTDAGHALRAGEVSPDDLIEWGGQIRRDVMTAMVQANIAEEAALPLSGESRKGDTAEPEDGPRKPEVFAYPEAMAMAPKHVTHVEDCSAQHWLFDADLELWYPRDRSGSYYSWPSLLHQEGPLSEVPPAQSGEATA